jgi:hypothetical protein
VHKRHNGSQRHLPGAEVERHHNCREDHKHNQRADGRTGDVGAPRWADKRRVDLFCGNVEGAGKCVTHLVGFRGAELRGLHPEAVITNNGNTRRGLFDNAVDGVDCEVLARVAVFGNSLDLFELELRSTTELDTEDKATARKRDDEGAEDHHGRDGVPDLAATNKVDRACSGV